MLSRLARSVFSQTRTIHTASVSAPLRSLSNCGETQMRHAVSIRRNTVDGSRRSLPSVVSASEAVKAIQSNQTVYVHQGVCAPDTLIDAMVERHSELRNVSVIHLHIEGKSRHANAEFKDSFRINAPFLGASTRKAVDEKRGDFIPVFLSDVPKLYRKGIIPIDVALIQVSPPDRHGFCTLGLSVCDARAAIESARYVIAQINPSMPRVYGDGVVHISDFDIVVEKDSPIVIKDSEELSPEAIAIGKNVASLIDNGSCLQMGIGALPDASLMALTGHKDLGIHTEMFSDKLVDLVEAGAVSGMNKAQDRGKIVSSFLAGSKKLYDFVNENPEVLMLDVEYVNNPSKVALNRQMCAINSCIELDLTGQVCSDSIGPRIFSGVGGQVDFMRAAAISEGGKPIMVLNSCTSRGESKIVPFLKTGAGVVTTRAHVHFVVTEYGVADLFGKNLRQRAVELIKIAHPKHREALEKAAIERLGPLL